MNQPLYYSRFRRNLNSILRQLSQPSGPEAVFVEKRNGGDDCVLLSVKLYLELMQFKAEASCLNDSVQVKELQKTVPIIQHAYTPYIRLIDIPNPWRSEFFSDSLGAACPIITGEGPCYYVWDWNKWLDFRSKSNRRTRFGGPVYFISDEEASKPVKPIDDGSSEGGV